MTDGPEESRIPYRYEGKPAKEDSTKCAVCRDGVILTHAAGQLPDKQLLICVVCYFEGAGKQFWDAHGKDARSLIVCPRIDGEEPSEPPNDKVAKAEITFVYREDEDP